MRPILITAALLAAALPAAAIWLPIEEVTSRSLHWDITCDGHAHATASDAAGNIHIVWRGDTVGDLQVWYSRFDAPTRQWSSDTNISDDTGGVSDAGLAVDTGGDVHVAWTTRRTGALKLRRRDASTGTWSPPDTLRGTPGDSMGGIAVDELGSVHVAWQAGGPSAERVRYARHDASGWSDDTIISPDGIRAGRPSIASTPWGDLMVAWGQRPSESQVLARRRAANVWMPAETVSGFRASRPSVSAGRDSSFSLCWLGGRSSDQSQCVVYREWRPPGWQDTSKLSSFAGGMSGPSCAWAESGGLHVAWAGEDTSTSALPVVRYCHRDASGHWSVEQTLARDPDQKQRVSASASAATAQVVWTQVVSGHPAVRMRRYERVHDVGVPRIESPVGVVDSGSSARLSAWVRNYGEYAGDQLLAVFRIDGSPSTRVMLCPAPGESTCVDFGAWSARTRGWHFVSCSTSVGGDFNPSNDVCRDSFFVRVCDVAAESIVTPTGRMPMGLVTPEVVLRNCGNDTSPLSCYFRISRADTLVYTDSALLTLPAESTRAVRFQLWSGDTGAYSASCSVAATGDMHTENDTCSTTFTMTLRDVGATRIIWPIGAADSGSSGLPRAVVKNLGSDPETFQVLFRIGAAYLNVVQVQALAPGESDTVEFAPCTLRVRGWQHVSCTTLLDGDREPLNDRRRDSVFVRVLDAAVVRILSPLEVISRGSVTPRAVVAIPGNLMECTTFWFEIAGAESVVYRDSQMVMPEPGETVEVAFVKWNAVSGSYTDRCWVVMDGDMQPGNDSVAATFLVPMTDAAARAILAPTGTVRPDTLHPRTKAANLGEEPADVTVWFEALGADSLPVFRDSAVLAALEPGSEAVAAFRSWNAQPGTYVLRSFVVLGGDEHPANDTVVATLLVDTLAGRWDSLARLPGGLSRRGPSRGAALVTTDGAILALKGANTSEWFEYRPADSAWRALTNVYPDSAGRRVRAGAAACWDRDNYVYALKGGGARELMRYAITRNAWDSLPGLPEHTPKPKHGCGLAYYADRDGDVVYMVKGSGTFEFLAFEVATRQWHARRFLPAGPLARRARHGTCLVASGGRIFCLKGGTCEFYEYLPDGDSWRARRPVPLAGRGERVKRPGRGAALAADGAGAIYAFKGGRANEFWAYEIGRDTWLQLEDIPLGNSRKRVRDGGSLACLDGRVYALKGGGSSEFWRYDGAASDQHTAFSIEHTVGAAPPRAERDGVQDAANTPLSLAPCLVFDASGRVVSRSPLATRPALRSGVYFIRALDHTTVNKVLILR